MIGDALIAQILKQENVDWIGAYPYHSLIDEAAKINIKPIIPRQERTGVNMADVFSRINNGNKIGVFIMQHIPTIIIGGTSFIDDHSESFICPSTD